MHQIWVSLCKRFEYIIIELYAHKAWPVCVEEILNEMCTRPMSVSIEKSLNAQVFGYQICTRYGWVCDYIWKCDHLKIYMPTALVSLYRRNLECMNIWIHVYEICTTYRSVCVEEVLNIRLLEYMIYAKVIGQFVWAFEYTQGMTPQIAKFMNASSFRYMRFTQDGSGFGWLNIWDVHKLCVHLCRWSWECMR